MHGIFGAHPRIKNINLYVVFRQLTDNIDDFGIAEVWTIFLECKPHKQNASTVHVDTTLEHSLDQLRNDIGTHTVIQTAASQDDLWMIANTLGFMSQIIWIDSDAMTAD
ncbi:hypothetical protein T227_09920 [Pseudomonas aeruginosa LESlike5]|nr:hypothetical protein T223_09600 [Pseudomonas aeruginosa LES431]AHH53063.1 hypothetical protein AI22_24280 [Pseudomonas aeruginosa YL84]AHK86853.1 hypothetical protein T227_09920 [Pseudomonas aeruginosa LESlike5]AHK92727.1 hypothetical protein T228_09605 [Pseudomonas aeruginosa LESlike7]AHK98731.1 hypothetical protein T222_09930 [Pseudomonas aeruginosa LES400]AHL04695.1 hypothetical protein T224_09915 [Pseudomonas aeruginosa LESB65]AHL10619.1 hypothetical protein T225_09920 [Pseudomonas aer